MRVGAPSSRGACSSLGELRLLALVALDQPLVCVVDGAVDEVAVCDHLPEPLHDGLLRPWHRRLALRCYRPGGRH
jgi:hypothetical protein